MLMDVASSENALTREDLLKELRRRMKSSMRVLNIRRPKTVTTVQYALRSFIKRESRLPLDRFPREQFITQQVILVGSFALRGLQDSTLTFLDLREDLGNLVYLLDYLNIRFPREAVILQTYIYTLLAITDEICGLLEKAAQVTRTDWQAVKSTFQYTDQPQHIKIELCVPKLHDIEPLRLLGAGGFGAVYKVRIGGVTMGGKLIPVERMHAPRHACIDKVVASMINSPYLVKYNSCFATDKAYVTLMEYIRGVDLNRIIKVGEPIDDTVCAVILAQLGLAVQYLHFRGFIHRDIKPTNMMVLPGGRMKLIDLDTCKVCTSLYANGYTRTFRRRTFAEFNDMESVGTRVFLSPEILSLEPYGRATDWWAVGVTAYVMGTGKLPFRGSEEEAKRLIKDVEYRSPNERPALKPLIERLLQKNPRRRISSARFEEYQQHPYFEDVDWSRLDETNVCEIKVMDQLMKITEEGEWSALELRKKRRQKKERKTRLTFAEISDIEKHRGIYTYFTEPFRELLRELADGVEQPKTKLAEEPYDLLASFTERRQRASYRFKAFLRWKTRPEDGKTISLSTTTISKSED
ncbi:probable serine/threonine-protein kinase pkgA isoform X2 [Varroa destructor]|uniref:Serine/threonine-protein kinase greatwall n=1 Tax=Varroa destructor TaxID=109461 RepID=A0A7M7JLS2_VARDE|nr:probable serine/threonine-protein kinase pkgA isoform X2 [Varroa destructor]